MQVSPRLCQNETSLLEIAFFAHTKEKVSKTGCYSYGQWFYKILFVIRTLNNLKPNERNTPPPV